MGDGPGWCRGPTRPPVLPSREAFPAVLRGRREQGREEMLRSVRLWEGASAKDRQWALEAGKGRESDAPLESPEGTQPCW